MRHRKRIFKIGRRPDHVRSLLANQVCSLIIEGRIHTTLAKAKEVRRLAEKMVTLGKRESLHGRRRAIAKLHQVGAVRKLFNEIAPKYTERKGGYTRIIKLGQRRGDAAPMCYLEFVEQELQKAKTKNTKADGDKSVSSKKSEAESNPVDATLLSEEPKVNDTASEDPENASMAQEKTESKIEEIKEATNEKVDVYQSVDSENESPKSNEVRSSLEGKNEGASTEIDEAVELSKAEGEGSENESSKDSKTNAHDETDSDEDAKEADDVVSQPIDADTDNEPAKVDDCEKTDKDQ